MGAGADCALESLLCSEDKNRSYTCCSLEIHTSAPRICPTHQSFSLNSLQVASTSKKRSKDTWQSNTGYLAIYPWIHCQVSLDTFSGQFRLLRKGYSIRDVAKLCGKGVSTIQRVKCRLNLWWVYFIKLLNERKCYCVYEELWSIIIIFVFKFASEYGK